MAIFPLSSVKNNNEIIFQNEFLASFPYDKQK